MRVSLLIWSSDRLQVPFARGVPQRRDARLVRPVGVSTRSQEEPHDVRAALHGRQQQGRHAVPPGPVRVGPRLKKGPRRLRVALAAGRHQGRGALLVAAVPVRAGLAEEPRDARVLLLARAGRQERRAAPLSSFTL